jgi:A/G-specific adenine glycosylase
VGHAVPALLAWTEGRRRDLPWRRTRDPWAVLVSELMLQQTQVARVASRWPDFLERFPTPAACAAAPPGDVIRAWAGLGYNRRALNLHRAATAMVQRHGGAVPSGLPDLLALPGVGPYTARAVQAFAFEVDVGLVEVNSARVLARAHAGRPLTAREAQAMADSLVPAGKGWVWNSAMLDLGATVCTGADPACHVCPIAADCAWRAAGRAGPDPSVGTAGVGARQVPFAGSDRQGRGRLVAALRRGPVAVVDLPRAMGWPGEPQRARRIADALVSEGLAQLAGERLRLP